MSVLFSKSSEERLLTALVRCGGAALDRHHITAEHFFDARCSAIYRAAESLFRSGKPVNEHTIENELGEAAIEGMGGIHALHEITYGFSDGETAYDYGVLCDKLTLRRAYQLGRWLAAATEQPSVDVPDMVRQLSEKAAAVSAESDAENCLQDAIGRVIERCDRMLRGETAAIWQTPIPAWNKLFGGIMDGNYYALVSRPGHGKTAMMEQIVAHYLDNDRPVVVFEKDMSPQKFVERMICRIAGVTYSRFQREVIDSQSIQKIKTLAPHIASLPLRLLNPKGMTADEMCSIARREIRTSGARAVFLDHIQTLRLPGKDLRAGLTDASISIRQLVTETGVPFIALAHLNREAEGGKRPSAANVKEFDQLYGDVDAMGILWSDVDRTDAEAVWPMKLFAAKNREGGVAEEELNFDGPAMTFKAPKL